MLLTWCGAIFEAPATVVVRIPKHKAMASPHAINDLLALLGRRWVLRILWELRGDPVPFGRLREACDEVSTSVLSQRLRELRDEDLVTQDADGAYTLTADGRELGHQLIALSGWATRRAPGRTGG
jgi:DNA-binding HxlR family transcriptional regulator